MEPRKKYNIESESEYSSKLEESSALNLTNISQADALWTLILNQAEEVQKILANRLQTMLYGRVQPYTERELHDRLLVSEQQFVNGEFVSDQQLNDDVNKLFESWKDM